MNSKIRAALRAYASKQDFIATIGKDGINENLLISLNDALESRELIKINVLKNTEKTAKDFSEELAVSARAEVITVIGSKIVLYRKSHKKGIVHLLEKLQQDEKKRKMAAEDN